MKQNWVRVRFVFFSVIVLLALACSVGTAATPIPESTATPVSTKTAAPPPTSTQRPTSTPRPTATDVPPTPTPAKVGETVSNDKYEVTVIKVRKLDTVYLDAQRHWVANPGNLFAELSVKVSNLGSSQASVPWSNIYIVDKEGSWYPNWAGYKSVATGVDVTPTKIIFASIENPDELIVFDQDVYLRLIWVTADYNPSVILFGFDDSPMIEVTID